MQQTVSATLNSPNSPLHLCINIPPYHVTTVDVKLEVLAKTLLAGNEDELMKNLRNLGINELSDQNKKWYMDALAEALKKKREVCQSRLYFGYCKVSYYGT